MHHDNDLPVLNQVVKAGNESIIESTRMGHEVLEQLEAMKSSPTVLDSPTRFEPVTEQTTPPVPGTIDGSVVRLKAELARQALASNTPAVAPVPEPVAFKAPEPVQDAVSHEESIELMIDELVDRHVNALRADLRQLLLAAQKNVD